MVKSTCCLCDKPIQPLIDLPGLPLTEILASEQTNKVCYDQAWAYCEHCHHGQILNLLDPDVLYSSENYQFRTATSPSGKRGADYFLKYLENLVGDSKFRNIIEVGANDLYLLKLIQGDCPKYGIDPLLKGQTDDEIEIIPELVENVNFDNGVGLVVCRHTLEHILHPAPVLEKLLQAADSDSLFVFEFPCFNILHNNGRYDQIFHQHAQYFTVQSVKNLIERSGGCVVDYTFNHGLWGALIITFKKGSPRTIWCPPSPSKDEVEARYHVFQDQMKVTRKILDGVKNGVGYGAAIILPLLAYHLDTDFAMLESIVDDDPSKQNLYYPGIVPPIRACSDLSEKTIFITAVDAMPVLLPKLLASKTTRVIAPVTIMSLWN